MFDRDELVEFIPENSKNSVEFDLVMIENVLAAYQRDVDRFKRPRREDLIPAGVKPKAKVPAPAPHRNFFLDAARAVAIDDVPGPVGDPEDF